ncbi:MAG: hypothetical protein ACRDK2_06090, partial [Solirubrobacteraceae bacterium]
MAFCPGVVVAVVAGRALADRGVRRLACVSLLALAASGRGAHWSLAGAVVAVVDRVAVAGSRARPGRSMGASGCRLVVWVR